MNFSIGAVILAAGEGKRLKLDVPKPLAPCLDKKLVDFPIKELKKFFGQNKLSGRLTVVVGHKRELVQSYIEKNYQEIHFALQAKQLGTGDALKSYFASSEETKKCMYTVVICADTPVVSEVELTKMFHFLQTNNLEGVAATFREDNPTGYGRIVRSEEGLGFRIVEEKDANVEVKKIKEVNSGLYIIKTSYLLEHLKEINSNNNSGEFYLTDIFKPGLPVEAICFDDKNAFLGVNTLLQLEAVEHSLRERIKSFHRENGVRFIDSRHVYVDSDVEIGEGSVIYPGVYLSGKTVIGKKAIIENGSIIKNSKLEDGVIIKAYSVIEEAQIKKASEVGPFARLRPGTELGEKAKIGNFVEIKKSVLDRGVKVSHLSYVGDAFIGEETNIGCGFITCNYDGANKHITRIGKNCFIGSDSQTVAPVEIGDDCFVASSTTITKSLPNGAFAISRSPQVTKEGMAHRFVKKKE